METLQQAVRENLRNYFCQMGKEDPIDFYFVVLEEIERPMFEFLINQTNFNQVKMSKFLGISRGTLRKKLKHYQFL